MKCRECGEELLPNVKECPNCGEPVVEVSDRLESVKSRDNASESLRPQKKIEELLNMTTQQREAGIGLGDKNNVMGSVVGKKVEANSVVENTSTHIEANTTNSQTNNQVDNSQNVVNNSHVTYNIIYQQGTPTPSGMPESPFPNGAIPNPVEKSMPQQKAAPKVALKAPVAGVAEENAAANEMAKAATKHSSKNVLIGVTCVLLLLLAGVYVVLQSDKKEVVEKPAAEKNVEVVTTQEAPVAPAAVKKQVEKPSVQSEKETVPVSETAANPPVDEKYDAGMKAYEEKDGLSAIKAFKESNSAQSIYMIGLIYEKGCGSVAGNAMMARKFYKEAASKGSEEAKAKL